MMSERANTTRMLAPHLVCDGAADAIDFYKKAFGAEEMVRIPGPSGRLMHAAVTINGSMVMLVDENKDYGALSPKSLGGSPVTIYLNVPDVDDAVARAEAAGATIKMPVADQFWGDRYGMIQDPFGHNWSIATPLRDKPMNESELREAAQKAMA
ncbi:MAG: VOC family protein [Sphingosinicella sp.]|nr:VOC family protein [Sphingosinicella sp.]